MEKTYGVYDRPYKTKFKAIIIALFFGGFGLHRAYTGQRGLILSILFFWTGIPALIALIDIIIYASMSEKKWNKKFNTYEC